MLHGINTIKEMNDELRARCVAGGLRFECGCDGNFSSTIAIVAEAPGEREVATSRPLVGNSGKFLFDVLRKSGLTRNHVYLTNVIKRQNNEAAEQHTNTRKQHAISKQELSQWRELLLDELTWLPNLQYIVAMGNYAIEALLNETGIMKFRGSVLPIQVRGRTVQVLCVFNSAYPLREPKQELVFRMDMGKLQRLINGQFHAPEISTLINPTYRQALDYIAACKAYDGIIAHDIEVMANETACVGLAMSDTEGMCINFRSQGNNLYSLSEERDIRLSLQDLLADTSKQFVAQNGHFDASWLYYKDRIRVHSYWLDTMLAHHLLYPSLPHGLGFLTAQYTDYPYYKDEGKDWREEGDIDSFWAYNVKDCCITRIVARKLAGEAAQQGMSDVLFNHIMPLQRHLVDMTALGVLCDTELKDRVREDLRVSLEAARELCQTTAQAATGIRDYKYNPGSWHHLAKLFFSDLKLVGRGTSTDKANRERMRKHPRTSEAAREMLTSIDAYLRDTKFFGTYTGASADDDGRFRTEWKQTGVASAPGRLASGQTMWGSGLNMQNIPERAKGMFVADEGYEFSYYDMSQIEARFVAYLADIPSWKQQFERARLEPGSYDAHRALASEMYGVPYEQVPTADFEADPATGLMVPTIRYKSKRCRHGLNYRMQPPRLAESAGMSLGEAEKNYRLYHRAAPQITLWWDDIAALVRRDRRITSCLGRRWVLLEKFTPEALDAIVAFEPQSMNGDHTSRVITKCHNDPEWPRSKRTGRYEAMCIINVHDANIAINRPQDGELVRAIMRKYAEAPFYINSVKNRLQNIDQPEELIVPAEFGVSKPDEKGIHRWSTIRKIK